MELVSSNATKPLTDPQSDSCNFESSSVKISQSTRKHRRNIVSLTVLYTVILIIVIVLILMLKSCPKTYPFQNASKAISSEYLDTVNRSCFYQHIRLPKFILPTNYSLFIHPNISQMKYANFNGSVTIDCVCHSRTDFVVLHSKNLKIISSSVRIENEEVRISVISICPKLDQFYMKFKQICEIGQKIQIQLNYSGSLEKRLDGFYLSDYKTKQGLEKTIITTHMEPTYARQAFPCFDEPLFKANFSLKMVRDGKHYSLFNMPLKFTEPYGQDLYLDIFYPTVRMSTYLVAYMVLPYDYINVTGQASGNRTQIRIFAPQDQKDYTYYALEITKKVLPFFENLFGLDYPLPKLDMIAIPDFSAGAMENWGLITYKFFALLINPNSTKIHHRTSIAKIVSHEIAHQWFGNIVTMDWWNDLWLNEGFASYTEYLGGDHVNKEWRMMEQFYWDQFLDAMNFDSLINSHPIQVPVKDPQEIEAIFDQISYGKGASLVRMLENVLGMATLKAGLKIYLQRYRYQTAISDNLWMAFSEAYSKINSNVNDKSNPLNSLKFVMSTWLNQMNFPVLSVVRTGPISFKVTQERFLMYPNASNYWKSAYPAKHNYLWSVPILFVTDKMEKPELIWLELEKEKEFKTKEPFEWIKLNSGQTGFYRVNYDESLWKALSLELRTNQKTFSTVDRAGLLSDAFSLARAGKLKIEIALDLSTYLVNEYDHIPWCVVTQSFSEITKQLFFDAEAQDNFEKFAQKLIDPILKHPKIGSWKEPNLTPYEILTRSTVLLFAVTFRHEKAMNDAYRFYREYRRTNSSVNSNLHHLTLYSGILIGGREEWYYLKSLMDETRDSEKQRVLRKTLAKTRDIDLLNQLFFISMNKYKHQDVVATLFDASQGNSAGVDQAWLFLQRHWSYFEKNVIQQYFLISELFKICYGLMTEADFDQANRFFSSKDLGFGDRSAKQALEVIRSNIFWNQINAKPLKLWLRKYFGKN